MAASILRATATSGGRVDEEGWEGSQASRADRLRETIRGLRPPSWASGPGPAVVGVAVFAVGVLVGATLLGDIGEDSCRDVFERARPARNELSRTFGGGVEGRDALRELLSIARSRPDCFRPEEIELFEATLEEQTTEPPTDAATTTGDPDSLSFDGGDVFATGQTEGGIEWAAAARPGEPPCVGVRIEASGGRQGTESCSPRTTAPIHAVRTTNGFMMVVAGWVSDEVSRIVWELPDGPQEATIYMLDHLPERVFVARGPLPDSLTMLLAYDSTGRGLGGIGIGGASEEQEQPNEG